MRLHFGIPLTSLLLSAGSLADDFDTAGERAALERQLEAVSPEKPLPGWHALMPASRRAPLETPEQTRQHVHQLNQKLDSIRLEQVDFQSITLKDALLRLAAASKQNDPNGAEPYKGVSLLLKLAKRESANLPKVTLQLKNVTLREALVKLSASSTLQMDVRPYGVTFHD